MDTDGNTKNKILVKKYIPTDHRFGWGFIWSKYSRGNALVLRYASWRAGLCPLAKGVRNRRCTAEGGIRPECNEGKWSDSGTLRHFELS